VSEQRVYVATETFTCELDGQTFTCIKDQTRVRAGHPLLAANGQYFREAAERVQYDVEDATAEPGRRRAEPR